MTILKIHSYDLENPISDIRNPSEQAKTGIFAFWLTPGLLTPKSTDGK